MAAVAGGPLSYTAGPNLIYEAQRRSRGGWGTSPRRHTPVIASTRSRGNAASAPHPVPVTPAGRPVAAPGNDDKTSRSHFGNGILVHDASRRPRRSAPICPHPPHPHSRESRPSFSHARGFAPRTMQLKGSEAMSCTVQGTRPRALRAPPAARARAPRPRAPSLRTALFKLPLRRPSWLAGGALGSFATCVATGARAREGRARQHIPGAGGAERRHAPGTSGFPAAGAGGVPRRAAAVTEGCAMAPARSAS